MGFTRQTPLTQMLLILLICGGMFSVVAIPLAELPAVDIKQLERRFESGTTPGYRNPMWYLDRKVGSGKRLPLKNPVSRNRPEEWTLYLTSTGFRAEKKEGTLIALKESEIPTLMYKKQTCRLTPSLQFTKLEQLQEAQKILRDIPQLQKKLGADVHFENNLDYIQGIAQYLTKLPLERSEEHVLSTVPPRLEELIAKMKGHGFDGSFPSASFDPSRPPLPSTHSGTSQPPTPAPPSSLSGTFQSHSPPPTASLENLDGTNKRKDTDILDETNSKKIKEDMNLNRFIN
ncbi:hypothetical protein GGU10DRAFT_345422 [Lentinula aff. detonsa]|uniref:Uncharacterized protein n=1 Tax=Lentinula aff. detonsa TaxID=2804958 RepID=A0AA38L655_9AGAR|nr:hypothetical protein GGU10DRAFT_345422 [Lentinula aff. detonsa]